MRYDQLAKQLFQAALARAGTVEVEREVAMEAQKVDVWFDPDPARARERDRLGLLGRMVEQPALFEAFHEAPGADEIRECLRKHFALQHQRRRADRSLAPPLLWIISAGRPLRRMAEFGFEPMTSWPAGTYAAPPGLGLRLVVLPELPRARDTLLLRLLGAGKLLAEALADLAALPGEAAEATLAVPVVVRLRFEIEQNPERTREEEELMAAMDQTFEEFEQRLRQEGRQQGRQEGRREAMAAMEQTFEERERRVRREERQEEVRRIVALRLRRPLRQDEANTVDERVERLGAERIENLVIDSTAADLAAWLARPDAV